MAPNIIGGRGNGKDANWKIVGSSISASIGS